MQDNPYRAPGSYPKLNAPGERLPPRAWLVVAFLLTWATAFAVQGAVFLVRSARVLLRYAAGEYPSLEYAFTVAGLGIMQLAMCVFIVWMAEQFMRNVRRAPLTPQAAVADEQDPTVPLSIHLLVGALAAIAISSWLAGLVSIVVFPLAIVRTMFNGREMPMPCYGVCVEAICWLFLGALSVKAFRPRHHPK